MAAIKLVNAVVCLQRCRDYADTDDPLRVSLTAHQVQNRGSTRALSPISLIFLKRNHLSSGESFSRLSLS